MSLKTPLADPAAVAASPFPTAARGTKALGNLRKSTPAMIIIAILAVLVLLPLALVLLAAFSDAVPRPGNISLGGLTLDNLRLRASPEALGALGNSLMVGAGSAVVALVIGAFLAFVCARTD
ncbi:MAG TPA: iron ABC transporter permease, partial [Arthrobacter sp.]|nr:iron ABC transporter permease [Arthrobacter sp.]